MTLFCWLSALIALPTVVYAGQPFYASALSALKGRRLNMDVPISLAIILATGMSLYQTVVGSDQVYFDAAVSLLFFLLIGRYLDEHLRVRARGEAQNLLSLQSGIASLIGEGGSLRPVPAHALVPGDKVLIGAGERVPADALVLSGSGDIDQSLITGETIPVAVAPGAQIYAGTLNLGSALTVEVTAADSATLLAEIGRLMAAAEQGKARYRRLADRAAQIYAPAVHGLGAATFLGWLIVGAPWQTALTYAIAVLIITCPCALALAVPAVQIAAASRLFRQGIVIKAADGLERVAEADMVVFDKTGTLTLGRPQLVNDAAISDEVLRSAAALAAASKHPYAQAVVAAARNRQIAVAAPEGVEETPGRGLVRTLPCGEERLGSAEWCGIAPGRGGPSEVWYARDWRAPVCFRFADALRSDAAAVVEELKRRGYLVALLSGDRKAAVEQAARASGITTWQSELTPARKIDWLAECAKAGPQGADGRRRPQRRAGACRGACVALAGERRRYQPARRRLRVPGCAACAGAGGAFHGKARAQSLPPEFRRRLLLQHRGRALCHGGLRDAADRSHRDVDVIDPRHAERDAACGDAEIMTALAWLIPAALFLGGLGLLAFLWALRSGQFEDLEGAAYRALEDDPPEDRAGTQSSSHPE